MQFSKQIAFGKNAVKMVFNSISKQFYIHFQNQEKKICEFGF